MANDYFQFKRFIIHQGQCAMKVGTDGVLLGAWANVEESKDILDVGTGTGLIAILAAQRNPFARIDAIEIDASACAQAKENVKTCPWNERIHVCQGAIQDFNPDHRYDALLCNPPFFVRSTPAPELGRTIARHCETLTHEDLLRAAERLLSSDGKLCVILPVTEAQNFIRLAQGREWFVNKLTNVFPTPQKPRKRCLIELSHSRLPYQEDSIIIETERHVYHHTFHALMRDFYLYL